MAMNCPACDFENREAATFCGNCGRGLEVAQSCESCGRSNPSARRFCDGCGTRLGDSPAPAASPERVPRSYVREFRAGLEEARAIFAEIGAR